MDRGADLGSIQAFQNLAVAYERGEGVEQDKVKGADFFKKAAMQGHVESRQDVMRETREITTAQ